MVPDLLVTQPLAVQIHQRSQLPLTRPQPYPLSQQLSLNRSQLHLLSRLKVGVFNRLRRPLLELLPFFLQLLQSLLSLQVEGVFSLQVLVDVLPAVAHLFQSFYLTDFEELSCDVVIVVAFHLEVIVLVYLLSQRDL